ncbi:MAG: prolyl oligopeptidase family serine peptidase, partial [Myxococcota bacterium]
SGWTKIAQWNGDRELTGDDVALRQTAAAAQRRPEVSLMPVSSQATFAYSLQVWDDWLAGPLPQTRPPVVPLSEAQSWLKAWIKAVTTGRDPISGQRGLHRRAYRSPLDGRYQPYALMIPPDYDPSQQHPLMVGLHGHTGTPTRMCRAMLGGRARPPKHRPPFVLVCPFGYGETAFRYVGEDDLFRVLAEVERDLSIDPDRIALTGLSDGGLAAFEVALHHPDRWSAVAPLAGVADMRAFPTIGTGRHTPYEARWLKRVSAVHRAMNGSALRFVIAYGAQDRLEERWVEGIVDALRHHGAQVDYTLHPTLGHNVWDTTYAGGRLFEQLVNARRPSRPEVIRYRSYSPRRRGGWDVVIDDADWDAGAELHVDHRTQGEVGVVGHHIHRARIGLRGATRLTVGNAAAVTVASTAVELRWEGAPGPVAIKPLTQVPGPPTWPLAEGQRGRIAVAGPLDELRAGAAVYLYGTGDPASTALYRYLAALEQRRWGRGVTLRTRLAADTE